LKGYSYFSIIRHAERADKVEEEANYIEIKDDPPLSKLGLEQASFAG
jgi:broad specificity phosphatase PhoE